jgi:DNA replication protein DnaC
LAWNQPFSEWNHAFPDPAITVAAIDSIVHHATITDCNTESDRRRIATENRDPETACAKI